ncbi:MAG TPA: hypothetical protein VFI47_29500, partial [Acidimicrobiales bacterium]|nr:hypothetical protein [Acidimicrobiales bacterium]
RQAVRWTGAGLVALAVLVPSAAAARTEPDTSFMGSGLSDQVGQVVGPVTDAIEGGEVPGGPDGTFLVTWTDPVNLGGQGQGLMLELERAGYDVRAPEQMRLGVRDHRVAEPGETDAEIHLAVGDDAIAQSRAEPGATEIAYHDPRTPAQRAEHERLKDELAAALTDAGLTDLVPMIDTNLYAVTGDPRVPQDLALLMYIVGTGPVPLAVFAEEPGP